MIWEKHRDIDVLGGGMKKSTPILFILLMPVILIPISFAQNSVTLQDSYSNKTETENELDNFMAKVLRKRDIDWEKLRDYIFNSTETLEIRQGEIPALENFCREYSWYVQDGYLVRSPIRIDGVKISSRERAEAVEKWINDEKKKRENDKTNQLNRQSFFGFKFEPGRYLYAGKQQFEGREVVVVEYYPDIGNDKNNDNKYEDLIEKSILITLLIDPEEYQIVQFTFDNAGFEFLPARWLVRLEDIKGSLIMDKPLGDVWLPREITAYGSISTANMELSVHYSHEFYSYAKTDVKVKYWFEPVDQPTTHEE